MAVEASKMANVHPDANMARIAHLASLATNSPIALVSILSSTIQWCKASLGLPIVQTKREWSFCTYTILQSVPFIVEDARRDTRFNTSPLVLAGSKVSFYAGVALHDRDGMAIGTLCVMDREPRKLRVAELDALVDLAAIASKHLASSE
ncbi:GAF domain-containing protein [Massilia sp. Mn16-1_5]|uniref:GAF domain-containing protein n=1 Tax=Massilia sp. Mn16-1_5 TaxID=2079199 RepID=UPI00109E814A|nr:GAF domain-containing protein [Massilia sp. Mn16-1_5]THC40639.1 hypothetical protein C2862_21140 [Massilia sp. Mn16-1_5]